MTTPSAIVIATAMYCATQLAIALMSWFVAFPWQRRHDRKHSAWSVFPTLTREDAKSNEGSGKQ